MTAFDFAAGKVHVAAMELLLAHGADPNAKDEVRVPLGSLMAGGKREREEGCSAALGPVMRCAQARMSRLHKSCARHDAHNHMKLEK